MLTKWYDDETLNDDKIINQNLKRQKQKLDKFFGMKQLLSAHCNF